MRLKSKITTVIILLTFTACVPNIPKTSLKQQQAKPLLFETSQAHFIHSLNEKSTLQERNDFIDEFILKSDIQCQNYLNNPLKKPETDESKTSLYMNLFDSVATLFGISLVTNSAKAVFLENDVESNEEKKAFATALSPEIRKGVELGRARYARTIKAKKKLDLNTYSIQDVNVDIKKYDRQCDDAYGLIEINRALKEMQTAINRPPSVTTPAINPNRIKDKVIEVTKEVEEKKEGKKLLKHHSTESNTTKVLPTQPKPVSVPLHHDNAPQMRQPIQL